MTSSILAGSRTRRSAVTVEHERTLWSCGLHRVAGVDEAGRGPLAGPVVAAAVVFAPGVVVPYVNDSKLLSEAVRNRLYDHIIRSALAVGVGAVDNGTIDEINILNATFRAMGLAVEDLPVRPDYLLVDGNRFPGCGIPFATVINGDARSHSIAAASVVAKVTRDRLMREYDRRFPGYGFARHKGYPTKQHRQAIRDLGLCDIHRRSFHLLEGA